MTGAKYGIYDLEWIIKSLEIDEESDRLYVSARGIYAVEDYLQARYYMFRQVYFHRTLRSAEAVLRSLVRRALHLFQRETLFGLPKKQPFEKILKAEKLSLTEHLELDDSDVMFHIKQWQNSDDKILSDLAKRFLHRRLFKAFDLDMPENGTSRFSRKSARNWLKTQDLTRIIILSKTGRATCHIIFTRRNAAEPKKLIYVEDGFSRPQFVKFPKSARLSADCKKVIKFTASVFRRNLRKKLQNFTINNFTAERRDTKFIFVFLLLFFCGFLHFG